MIALGTPPDDSSIASLSALAIAMKKDFTSWYPVTDVYVPPEGVTHLIVIGVKKGNGNLRAKSGLFPTRRVMTNKHIVVDADVDVFNMAEVLHCFATRCHRPRESGMSGMKAGQLLTPFYSPKKKKA